MNIAFLRDPRFLIISQNTLGFLVTFYSISLRLSSLNLHSALRYIRSKSFWIEVNSSIANFLMLPSDFRNFLSAAHNFFHLVWSSSFQNGLLLPYKRFLASGEILVDLKKMFNSVWYNEHISLHIYIYIIYVDCLVQDCSISIANELEILQSCTNPLIWWRPYIWSASLELSIGLTLCFVLLWLGTGRFHPHPAELLDWHWGEHWPDAN